MRIYYITRTYPDRKNGGGGIARKGTINSLRKKGYEVWIISPCYENNKIEIDEELKHILLPYIGSHKLFTAFEYTGLVDDYLEWWAIQATKYLKNIVHKEDILFATSGGELGCIILGKLLKEKIGCKLLVNFHDPIDFTTVFGEVTNASSRNIPHKSRDKAEEKYLQFADAIITVSLSYKNALEKKYPYMQGKIFNNYLGYTDKIDNMKQKEINTPINIVFGGSMGFLQAPEILAEAANGLNDIRIIYIGDWKKNQNLNKYVNSNYVKLVDALGFDDFADYMLRNADIGFVSLKGQVSKLCIPYKFYELINFGVPVLAAIDGDLKKIIENNEYGVVSEYNTSSLRDAIVKMTNKKDLLKYKNNILKDRTNWSAEKQIDVLINIIENL